MAISSPNWRIESTRQLLQERWIDLRADRCITADGAVLDPYYVLRYPDWSNVVGLTAQAEVVVIRQYRHGIGAPVLELPGGAVDANENPADAALRELREETGYAASAVQPVCRFPANPATHTNFIHTYLATDITDTGRHAREAGEDLVVSLMPAHDLVNAIRHSVFGQSMQAGPVLLALEMAGVLRMETSTRNPQRVLDRNRIP